MGELTHVLGHLNLKTDRLFGGTGCQLRWVISQTNHLRPLEHNDGGQITDRMHNFPRKQVKRYQPEDIHGQDKEN
jgi:hypothetical protein